MVEDGVDRLTRAITKKLREKIPMIANEINSPVKKASSLSNVLGELRGLKEAVQVVNELSETQSRALMRDPAYQAMHKLNEYAINSLIQKLESPPAPAHAIDPNLAAVLTQAIGSLTSAAVAYLNTKTQNLQQGQEGHPVQQPQQRAQVTPRERQMLQIIKQLQQQNQILRNVNNELAKRNQEFSKQILNLQQELQTIKRSDVNEQLIKQLESNISQETETAEPQQTENLAKNIDDDVYSPDVSEVSYDDIVYETVGIPTPKMNESENKEDKPKSKPRKKKSKKEEGV